MKVPLPAIDRQLQAPDSHSKDRFMTALEQIVKWAETELPDWQSDAVRRLLTQGALTDGDSQELLLMVKSGYGLVPDGPRVPVPQPLGKGLISGAPDTRVRVTLKAVKNLQNVNAIPDGSELPFGHVGLTAVYGENGAGKSGYARVLKRACRARDTKERILPNVYDASSEVVANATFKLSVDDSTDQEVSWVDGKSNSDDILTNISVFDSKCARVIVDERNQATYEPYGAHVFQGLVDVLDWIKGQIDREMPPPSDLQFPEVEAGTPSAEFLAGLSHSTDNKAVDEATAWSEEDDKRLKAVSGELARLEANDPAKEAAKIDQFKDRVTRLKKHVEHQGEELSDGSFADLNRLSQALKEAQRAVELASEEALQDEPLKGAGGDAWRMLYEAAKKYSTQTAYAGEQFPFTGENSLCVLCMQPLSDDAKERFVRFANFMEQETKRALETAQKNWNTRVAAIETLEDSAATDQHTSTLEEVRQEAEDVANEVEHYLGAAEQRLKSFRRFISDGDAEELMEMPKDPVPALAKRINALEAEAKRLRESADPDQQRKLREEKAHLSAQKSLSKNRGKICAHIKELKKTRKCQKAIASMNTRAISSKVMFPRFR